MTRWALALILVLVSTPLGAQWLKHPTPGIPRNGDGTPNLTAPAPRLSDGKPDLSGIWRINPGAYNGNVLADWKPEEIPAWAGKASDEKKNAVKVAPEILAKYVGAYEFRAPEDPTFVMILNVTHSGEELFIDVAGKDKQAMISLSDTLFAAVGGRVEFIIDDRGAATEMVFHAVEGPMKAKRKPDTSGAKK